MQHGEPRLRASGFEVEIEQNTPEWLDLRRGPYLVPDDPEEIRRGIIYFGKGVRGAEKERTEKWVGNLQCTFDGTVDVRQRRTIWKIGASECGTACGVASYTGFPQDLYDKILYHEPEMNEADRREMENSLPLKFGHYAEDYSIPYYEQLTGYRVTDGRHFLFTNTDDALDGIRFGASPDGQVWVNGTRQGLLEIKNPIFVLPDEHKDMKKAHPRIAKYAAFNKGIKPEYMAQMQYQMFSAGASWCDFLTTLWPKEVRSLEAVERKVDLSRYTPEVFIKRVYFSWQYWAWMWPLLKKFSWCLEKRQRPSLKYPPTPPPAVPIVDFPHALEMHDYSAMRVEQSHAARVAHQWLPEDTFNTRFNTYSELRYRQLQGFASTE